MNDKEANKSIWVYLAFHVKATKHKTYSTVSRLNIFTPSVTKTGVELVLENILLLCAILPSTKVFNFSSYREEPITLS